MYLFQQNVITCWSLHWLRPRRDILYVRFMRTNANKYFIGLVFNMKACFAKGTALQFVSNQDNNFRQAFNTTCCQKACKHSWIDYSSALEYTILNIRQSGKHYICFAKWLTQRHPLSPSASATLGASMSYPGHSGCRQWHHADVQLRGRYSHAVLLLGETGHAAQAAAQRHARYYKQAGRRSSLLPHLCW